MTSEHRGGSGETVELIIVEPERTRRAALRAALEADTIVVSSAARALRELDSGRPVARLVVATHRYSKRRDENDRLNGRTGVLALLGRARELGVRERVLDARDCDFEFYAASRTLGTDVWPESAVEEATAWYREGLKLDLDVLDRLARDIAKAQVAQELELTPAEATLVFTELVDGGSYEEIGQRLSISTHTVKAHFRNMRGTTGLSRDGLRTHALQALLFARGFVERESYRKQGRRVPARTEA